MKTFIEKYNALYEDSTSKLIKLIRKNGVTSKHRNEKCLKIRNQLFMYNLEGGRYLTEVLLPYNHSDKLEFIDNEGYS